MKLKKDIPFTVAPNALIQDDTISDRARFLYVYMASKPDDWEFFLPPLARSLGYSIQTLRKYLKELEGKGWITNAGQNRECGTFGANEYTLHHQSQIEPCDKKYSTVDGSPCYKNSDTVKNRHGKSNTHTKERVLQKKDKEQKKETPPSFFPKQPDPKQVDGILFETTLTVNNPVCLKTGRKLYQDVYAFLVAYLQANPFHIDNIKQETGYRGNVAPILKAYLRNLQESGELYKLMPRTKPKDFNGWLSKILSGWEKYVHHRRTWDREADEKAGKVMPINRFKRAKDVLAAKGL